MSTHNPLGTTFAAGVYASIFGTSREPINAVYARRMFDTIRECRSRHPFLLVLGGSGAWQIEETDAQAGFGIDSLVTGRAESREVIDLFSSCASWRAAAQAGRRASSSQRGPAPRA